ncbi:hypothetical protein C8Q75DRAFT_736904 [Abortiporus biennis]|nr:hypothetical protein C8Q75DRAFT_736904 [Abortiporus biennis]
MAKRFEKMWHWKENEKPPLPPIPFYVLLYGDLASPHLLKNVLDLPDMPNLVDGYFHGGEMKMRGACPVVIDTAPSDNSTIVKGKIFLTTGGTENLQKLEGFHPQNDCPSPTHEERTPGPFLGNSDAVLKNGIIFLRIGVISVAETISPSHIPFYPPSPGDISRVLRHEFEIKVTMEDLQLLAKTFPNLHTLAVHNLKLMDPFDSEIDYGLKWLYKGDGRDRSAQAQQTKQPASSPLMLRSLDLTRLSFDDH